MLKEILTLMFTLALLHSNIQIQSEEIKEANKTIPIEKKVVQTVKVEKEKTIAKIEPKPVVNVEEEKWEVYNISAYSNGYESTQKQKGDPLYGIQANGERTVQGKSIACPKSMEFGTKVKINELNHTYECSDRGSAITKGKLDIFFEDVNDALEFGRQYLHVQIIKKEVD
ncbi:3D domain-containing protein [Paenibacillus sp. FSL E2-0178]|uniref:3D domain-containing protein n=1 Tax=Paenibacillus sp. FSL E2-0178 TaxID=2921361 RepID=UPI0031594859